MGCLLSPGLNVHPNFPELPAGLGGDLGESRANSELCGRDKKWKQNMFSFPGL